MPRAFPDVREVHNVADARFDTSLGDQSCTLTLYASGGGRPVWQQTGPQDPRVTEVIVPGQLGDKTEREDAPVPSLKDYADASDAEQNTDLTQAKVNAL